MHIVSPDAPEKVWVFQKIMIAAVVAGLASSVFVFYGVMTSEFAREMLPVTLMATVAVPMLATLGVTHDRSQFALWTLLVATGVEVGPLLPTLLDIGWSNGLALLQCALQFIAMIILFTDSASRHWIHFLED